MKDFSAIAHHLRVVLTRPKFPENVGAAARASANFGHAGLYIVKPGKLVQEGQEKAASLATTQGQPLLYTAKTVESLPEALQGCTLVVGTSARLGGERRHIESPREAARVIVERLLAGEDTALVFGPEDTGLENEDLRHCQQLVCIPTAVDASSLNLGQAVLLCMYEIFLAFYALKGEKAEGKEEHFSPAEIRRHKANLHSRAALSRRITHEERALLQEKLKDCFVGLDLVEKSNPDYFFMQAAHFLDKADVRRHEMDFMLGMVRKVARLRANALK